MKAFRAALSAYFGRLGSWTCKALNARSTPPSTLRRGCFGNAGADGQQGNRFPEPAKGAHEGHAYRRSWSFQAVCAYITMLIDAALV